MKLAVDARLMAGHPRGMGQYARALVEPMCEDLVALLPRGQATSEWPSLASGWGFFPWWEQVLLPRLARQVGATHLLCPSNTAPIRPSKGIKTICVVHDLIFLRPLAELPAAHSAYQNLGRIYRRMVVPMAGRRADVIATVSEYTRDEIVHAWGLPRDSIHVVPNSLDDGWYVPRPLHDELRQRRLLCVTGEAPSKNLTGLLQAYAALYARAQEHPIPLCVVGIKPAFHPVFRKQAREFGLPDNAVEFSGHVPEATLREWYRTALGFVLPSLYEGFGIPLLEAMASGTPVACSNTTSLPEVAGGAARLFDPRDTASMVQALHWLISERAAALDQATAGLAHAARFTRSRVARRIRGFWNDVAAEAAEDRPAPCAKAGD